jgi:hypothetical protein
LNLGHWSAITGNFASGSKATSIIAVGFGHCFSISKISHSYSSGGPKSHNVLLQSIFIQWEQLVHDFMVNLLIRTAISVEELNMIRKGQVQGVDRGDVIGLVSFLHEMFEEAL